MNRRDFLKGLASSVFVPNVVIKTIQQTPDRRYKMIRDESRIYNRIMVHYYAFEERNGVCFSTGFSFCTDYAENAESIARYGIKEMVYSMGYATREQAEAVRDERLKQYAFPLCAFVYQ